MPPTYRHARSEPTQNITFVFGLNHHIRPINLPEVHNCENKFFESQEHQGRLVGIYTQKERVAKIRKYKQKLQRWKLRNKDAFNGRSRVAKTKLRYFGRFIKSKEFEEKLISDEQIIKNNEELEKVIEKEDYNRLVDIITQNPSEIK